jgi:Ser-tRNA(Ala) deacylase AlaX
MYGNRALIPDFPDIQVDGIIEHVVHGDDMPLVALLTEGQQVAVCIDRLRRARLSLSHTASHLLYLGVMEVRPDAVAAILGCHIRPDAARFDFGIADRFKSDEVTEIERLPMRWFRVAARCVCMRMNGIPMLVTGNAKER